MSAGFKFLRSLGIVNRPYSVKKEKAMTDATKQKFLVLYLIPASVIISTEAGGKTKRVTASSVSDTKNDIILCSFVETESHEVAAKAFENHPHLQIPHSSIEVMHVRPMKPGRRMGSRRYSCQCDFAGHHRDAAGAFEF
jgi:hypothetical protein